MTRAPAGAALALCLVVAACNGDRHEFNVAPSGRDSDDCGEPEAPCASISHAIELAGSGATIRVHAGTYMESWLRLKDGMRLVSADGPLKAKVYSGARSAVRFKGVSDAAMEGFEVHGRLDAGAPADGLVRVIDSSGVTIRGCVLHDAPRDADVVKVSGRVDRLLIEDVVAYNPARRASAPCETGKCFQENIDIYGNVGRRGGPAPVRDVVVRGSWLFHTRAGGDDLMYSKINTAEVLFENNVFGPSEGLFDQRAPAGLGQPDPAVGIGTSELGQPDPTAYVIQHAIVRNNVFTGLRGDAALGVVNANDVWVYNNTFHANRGRRLRSVIEFGGNGRRLGAVRVFNNVFSSNRPTGPAARFYLLRDAPPASFFRGWNLYWDNVSASDVPYERERGSVYGSDPLLARPRAPRPRATSLARIRRIVQRFAHRAGSPANGLGLDAVRRRGHPAWAPRQTARRWDILQRPRPAGGRWDAGATERAPP